MTPSLIIQHYGYIGVAFALILEFLLIPFPAETILMISGAMWHEGLLHLVPLLIAATIGSWTGSMIAYGLGDYVGRPVIIKYGKYVRLDERNLHRAETAFAKYSIPIVGLGRFIAGIRVMVAYVAGINKMNIPLYMILTAVSAFLWATAFIFIGSTISAKWRMVWHWALHHPVLAVGGALLILAAGVLYWRWKRMKNRNAEAVVPD